MSDAKKLSDLKKMGETRRTPKTFRLFAMSLCVVASAILIGCGKHPKATSRESLEFIKQVYTACNTKNASRLAECDRRLKELQEAGLISEKEIKSFEKILALGRDSEWQKAQDTALRFAQDQVR